jgi:hypothetical protein
MLAAGRPVEYLPSSVPRKDLIAKGIAERDRIDAGPICTLTCVEPCWSYDIYRNRDTCRLELRQRQRKGLHLYHYSIHPTFGFMHVRIQSWFPFALQICLNGREWLARQMDDGGVGYRRKDNAFVALDDVARAQQLMDAQLRAAWPTLLDGIVDQFHPAHQELFAALPMSYYWSVHQSEWATDILFSSPRALARIYPQLVVHGIRSFGSPDVMRFLGKNIPAHGQLHRRFAGDVVSDLKDRPEGVRIKHRVNSNSIKLYDKHGSVLRVETTLNDPRPFVAYRKPQGQPDRRPAWLPLRKSIVDLPRRAEVSDKANQRYLEALASVDTSTPLGQIAYPLCQPTHKDGKRVRAINPFRQDDLHLLSAVSAAEFCIHGLRNRDLRQRLYAKPTDDPTELRRRRAAVTRKLRLLRAHGLIRKVPRSHRYLVTTKGRTALTALLAARDASTERLTELAA